MINRIQVFGERCSGTTYLENLIKNNFPNVELTSDYGWKHWFPGEIDDSGQADCLFLVVFRNPFDWLRSFHQQPWHCHDSLKNVPFSEFLRREWICVWDEAAHVDKGDPKYLQEMMFERDPETNQRFRNVLQLRNAKNRHFSRLRERVGNYCLVNYEDVRSDQDLLKELFVPFELKSKHKRVMNVKTYKSSKHRYTAKRYDELSREDLEFIRGELDWKQEAVVGYESKDYPRWNLFDTLRALFKGVTR